MESENRHERADFASELAAVVRARRKRLGLSQEDLAAMAEVSVRFVGSLEQGKATLQLETLSRVLHTLGLRLRLDEANA